MEKITTSRVLGTAEYEARWVARSFLVRLTAIGILPCANFSAQLEQRSERVVPPMWDLVFYIEPFCLKAIKPFSLEVLIHNPGGAEHLIVRDAAGEHEIPVLASFESADRQNVNEVLAEDLYSVHARLSRPSKGHHGCIVVPHGSILPAIYYRAFGPSRKQDCEDFVAGNCQPKSGLMHPPGGEIPWPLKA